MKKTKTVRGNSPHQLTEQQENEIKLWFGWGSILGYATGPKAYLRDALKPANRELFFAMPRTLRKLVLRFVIDESNRRAA